MATAVLNRRWPGSSTAWKRRPVRARNNAGVFCRGKRTVGVWRASSRAGPICPISGCDWSRESSCVMAGESGVPSVLDTALALADTDRRGAHRVALRLRASTQRRSGTLPRAHRETSHALARAVVKRL